MDLITREELIPVYEDAFDKDGKFVLEAAGLISEIVSLREKPKHLWYAPMQERHKAISYEETEKFYDELLIRLEGLLKFKVKDYIVKSLREHALEFLSAYEKLLDYKMREDEIKLLNILEGLNVLVAQSDYPAIVIFCGPMHYSALLYSLKKEKRLSRLEITVENIDIKALLDKMKPFTQKSRIMQSNYEIALKILGRKKPKRYNNPDSVLVPKPGTLHLT